jgi:hypothetical protein
MMRVSNWQDNDVMKKEVKSCDNHDLGDIQEVDPSYLIIKKGSRVTRVPRSAVATFDGDKVFLRATEAEVLAGIYPFRESTEIASNQTVNCSPQAGQPGPPTPPPSVP